MKAAGLSFKEVLPVRCYLLLSASSSAAAEAAVVTLRKVPAAAGAAGEWEGSLAALLRKGMRDSTPEHMRLTHQILANDLHLQVDGCQYWQCPMDWAVLTC
jgi:hypothetical protein